MKLKFTLIICLLSFLSCEKEKENEQIKEDYNQYVPTDVLVKIKRYYSIDKVFKFINNFNHNVESIKSQVYTSELSSDSLQYVLNYLNAKEYTNDGKQFFVSGYLHYQTKIITVFPYLFNITNKAYQDDWLKSINILKLKGKGGCIIHFNVPKGQEEDWVKRFKDYECVEWAELNYINQFKFYFKN